MLNDKELFNYIKYKKDWDCIKTFWHKLDYSIERDETVITLMFRPSSDLYDWKDNFMFLPVPTKAYKNTKNHFIIPSGFKKEYHSGNDTIMEKLLLELANRKTNKIIVTGWSNGAAMAVLAVEDIFFRTKIKPELILYGCPKVCFDNKTKEYIESCCYEIRNYCNKNDIVTKVPFIGKQLSRKIELGDNLNLIKLIKVLKYHRNYSEEMES